MPLLSRDPSSHRATPSVMLIEAEPMLRRTMTKFLRRSGYQVTACPDVQAGAGVLAEGAVRPSLIVLGARLLDDETRRPRAGCASSRPGRSCSASPT